MNILDFSPYYAPHIGGMEKYAEELHEHLATQGCDITVFTPRIPKSIPEEENKPHIHIIRYPACEIIFNYPLPCVWEKVFWKQWKKINATQFHITISTVRFFVQPLMALFFAKRHRIPLIHIEHCSDYVKNTFIVSFISRIVDMTIGRFALSHADTIIAPSQSAARFVHILSGRKATIIYRGMPFTEIDAIPPDNTLRQRIGDKTVIMYVGRLIFGKGVIRVLRAIRLLQRKDILFLIVGDGPERKPLEEYVAEHALSEQVSFFGNVPFQQVISMLKVTDIFINPSYNEGLPTSVLEAGVCRRAIIATSVGGTQEILTHNQSGIIIPPYSTQAVAQSLTQLLDNAPLRAKLGENARMEIEAKFDWQNTIETYMQTMRSVRKKI